MINTCKHNPCCGDMTYCVPPAGPTSIKTARKTMDANLDEAKEIADYLRLDPNRVGWISYEEADHAARMIDALIAQLSGMTDETSSATALTELQHRREAEAGVPVAFRWLDGEGYNAGWRYSDVDPREDDREVEMSGAHSVGACEPLYAASPSSPASGVRVKTTEADVERVARALAADELGLGDPPAVVESIVNHQWRAFESKARVALSALGEHP